MNKLILLSIVALSASCAGVKVNSAYDPTVNFNEPQTFHWIDTPENQYLGPDYAFNKERFQRIKGIIQSELEYKGLVNNMTSPDLLVGFHVIVEEKTTLIIDSEMFNPYTKPITYWDGYESFHQENYNFLKGTLIIDIIDATGGNVIWQGTAQRYMETVPKVDKNDMRKAIRKALKAYPPKQSTE